MAEAEGKVAAATEVVAKAEADNGNAGRVYVGRVYVGRVYVGRVCGGCGCAGRSLRLM